MNDFIFWGGLFLVSAVILFAVVIYIVKRVSEFKFISKLSKEKKFFKFLISAILVISSFSILSILLGTINSAIILLHLLIFWAIISGIQKIFKKKNKNISNEVVFLMAAAFTTAYMLVTAYLCFSVSETNYAIENNKNSGSIRVVLFADSHVGTTFDGKNFIKYVDRINKTNPDIVVIAGDLVDDSTDRQNMIDMCKSLGELKTRYGVYYCFGNHDKGYSSPEQRGFNTEDLITNLRDNNVTVLEDQEVLINDQFYVVGRQDKSEISKGNGRADAKDLIGKLDQDKYIIVLNHQPNDYANESSANADLVLSGHTHGGQMLPINHIGEWIKANDFTYGHTKIQNTNFIVTSGISDWEVYFKSGCRSEFVVIDIKGK